MGASLFAGELRGFGSVDRPLVHSLFTDHMVLQRDIACPVWGWSEPGDTVAVTFGEQTKTGTAADDGRWKIRLDPMPASTQPRTLTLKSAIRNSTSELRDVLVGDVWLCSGQSNMDFGIGGVNQWWNELPGAPVDGIRLFWVQPTSSFSPQDTVAGDWSVASREALLKKKSPYTSVGYSAIAWFYGRALHRETGVPIGLIESAQGNTAIQPWSTRASLRKSPKYPDDVTSLSGYERMLEDWAKRGDPAWPEAREWLSPDFDDTDWTALELPEDVGQANSLLWFRRQITLPPEWAGQALVLGLGPLREQSAAWFNGRFLGGHDQSRKGLDKRPIEHIFDVPPDAVRTGKNRVVVRVLGKRGLTGPADRMFLKLPGADEPVSLAGAWRFQAGTPLSKIKGRRRQPDRIWVPAGLYNGMIAPLTPFAIKGTIWYQGEGNAGQPAYAAELTALIRDWRAVFEVGDFPFYIVQLSGFGRYPAAPGGSSWAFTRELQARVAREVPNCGLAVSIDRGEVYDIHPPNKRDVGERLALVALARTYGKDVPCEGPTYREASVEADRIRIRFDHAEGLKSVGGGPAGFAIAGADQQWLWAQARIDGESVLVWSPDVPEPVAVRYGWGDNTLCNLYNAANLPAVPFRTDDWKP
jgi:sialate O-acetylesterase